MNKKLIGIGAGIVLMTAIVLAAVFYHSVPVSITVSEALSSTTISIGTSGFPGESIEQNISVNNAANVALNTSLTWLQDANANGVTYTTNLPLIQTLSPGLNIISVDYAINSDSPAGNFNGTITLQRVA